MPSANLTKPESSAAPSAVTVEEEATPDPRVIEFLAPLEDAAKYDDAVASQAEVARGRRAAQQGEWRKAERHFARAVAFDSDNVTALGELAHALQQLNQPEPTILRSAETLAFDATRSTRAAIVHNLAKAYEQEGQVELARRARVRSRLLAEGQNGQDGSEPDASQACPVVVRTAEPAVGFGTWLDAYEKLSQAELEVTERERALLDADGERPPVEPPLSGADNGWREARARLCKRADPGGKCSSEDGQTIRVSASGSFVTDSVHVDIWPLKGENVAYVLNWQSPKTVCPTEYSVGGRANNLLIHTDVRHESFRRWLDGTIDPDPCRFAGIGEVVHLYDVDLGRSFQVEGAAREQWLVLQPEEHALVIRGPFCEQRVSLDECTSGVCTAEHYAKR